MHARYLQYNSKNNSIFDLITHVRQLYGRHSDSYNEMTMPISGNLRKMRLPD